MIDTSVLVAGLVTNHEFCDLARPHVRAAAEGRIPGLVAAEAFAALRTGPWLLDAGSAAELLRPWTAQDRLVETPVDAYRQCLQQAPALTLGGNVHDLLIVLTCQHHDLGLATLDRRQATLARGLVEVQLLLPNG